MRHAAPVPTLQSAALAAALTALATALAWALDGAVSLTSQSMVYLLAVFGAAYWLRQRESVLTAVFGVTALNFFFVPPRHTLEVENLEYLITLGALLLVSLAVSTLTARLHLETAQARLREHRARELYALGETLAATATEAELEQRGLAAIHAAFGRPCAILTASPDGALSPVMHAPADQPARDYDRDAARYAFEHRESLGPPQWPNLSLWYVPLIGGDQPLGVLTVDLADSALSASDEDRRHLETLVRQVALALQRARRAAEARSAALEAEAEGVRNALLASISHDLRTPLSVIVGSATTLSAQRDRLSVERQNDLLRSIEDEATQMAATAENILQLARLSAGPLSLRRDWESIEEIVGSAIGRYRRRGLQRRIKAKVAPGLPLVHVDAVLVTQVLSNLIDNALSHAAATTPILVEAKNDGTTFEVAVKDRGPGLAGQDPDRLFARFVRGRSETPGGGAGLGLAICKAIVEAHGGRIHARERRGGGATFAFTLPADEPAPTLAGSMHA